VRLFARYRALYYSLGDELGIAETSSFWDFDLSPSSLHDMREWLKMQYASLPALNREWGTEFARWNEVMLLTTHDALMHHEADTPTLLEGET
jgi:hypothetical protein